MRERLGDLLGFGNTREGVRAAETAGKIADLLPFSGGALATGDAADAAQAGNMLEAGLLGGSSALGAMPLIGGMARRAVKAVRAPFDEAGSGLLPKSMYDLPAGSDPRYLGAAPDRSGMTFLRYQPKVASDRVSASIAGLSDAKNPVRAQMMTDIDRGLQLGGADWYNTEELRDWFVKELGKTEGHRQWAEFMDIMGATSPGSKVPSNIGNASAMRQRLYSDEVAPGSNRSVSEEYREQLAGVDKLADARDVARGRKKGYGHKTQGLQELVAARQQQGRWSGEPEIDVSPAKGNWTENPKPKGFAQSLKGSERNIAADLHFTRYMAMASKNPEWLTSQAEVGKDVEAKIRELGGKAVNKYFGKRAVGDKDLLTFNVKKAVSDGKLTMEDVDAIGSPQLWAEKPNDNEYAAFEKFMYEVGKERGLTGPQTQAALWMGAADRTGVDPTSQGTFMELLRRRADQRAAAEGLTREQVIRRFIRDKGLLAIPVAATGAGLLGSGEASAQDVDPTLWDYTPNPANDYMPAPGPSPDQTPPPGLLVMPQPVAPPPDYTRGLIPLR